MFDAADGTARLLRFRSGHAAPPAVVRYYGDSGTRLLSAGGDPPFKPPLMGLVTSSACSILQSDALLGAAHAWRKGNNRLR